MKRLLLISAAATAALALGACEDTYYAGDYGRSYYGSSYYAGPYDRGHHRHYYGFTGGYYDQYGVFHPRTDYRAHIY